MDAEVEITASVATEAVALAAFGPGAGAAPAGRVGAAIRPAGAPWLTVDLVGWSRPDVSRALALPLGVAWRPTLGRVCIDLGVGAGPLVVDHAPGVYVRDGDGWREAPGVRAGAVFRAGVGVGVDVTESVTPFVAVEELFQVPWGVAGQPLLPHRLAHAGVRVRLGGAR